MLVAPDVGNSMDLMDEHPKINGHRGLVQDLQFSPFFENILATASSDCTAKVWILPEDGLQSDLDESNAYVDLRAHQKSVMFCKWNPSVNFSLATASMD